MADKEEKIILEREYIIPLRRKFLKTPRYKRTPKAIKALKKFLAKHMHIYDRDTNKIKLDKYLNEEIWFRGIQNPPAKIKVKCSKFDSGLVRVELAELPDALKWKKAREEKARQKVDKKIEEKKAEEKKEGKKLEEAEGEKKDGNIEEKEKGKATVEAGLKMQDEKAKEIKHEVKLDKSPKHKFRQALQK